jgi:hypothetical protein
MTTLGPPGIAHSAPTDPSFWTCAVTPRCRRYQHATYEQIKELTTAILRGDPEALHLMYQGAKTKAQEFIPHRR